MMNVKRYLEMVFKQVTKKHWDTCIAIVGDEGVGKSTLDLWITEHWYTLRNGKVTADDAKHVCLTREQWLKDLSDLKKYELTSYDEAGDLNSRRAMSKFNTNVMKAYQIIRADNLLTIMVLPSLWELDSFFRYRRLRGFFQVYARGRCAFWGKDKMRKLMALNANRVIKNYMVVRPDFRDTFPIYKGVLLDPYLKSKREKMLTARQNLMKEDEPTAKDNWQRDALIKLCKEHDITTSIIAERIDLSDRHVRRIAEGTRSKAEATI